MLSSVENHCASSHNQVTLLLSDIIIYHFLKIIRDRRCQPNSKRRKALRNESRLIHYKNEISEIIHRKLVEGTNLLPIRVPRKEK